MREPLQIRRASAAGVRTRIGRARAGSSWDAMDGQPPAKRARAAEQSMAEFFSQTAPPTVRHHHSPTAGQQPNPVLTRTGGLRKRLLHTSIPLCIVSGEKLRRTLTRALGNYGGAELGVERAHAGGVGEQRRGCGTPHCVHNFR